MHLSRIYTKFVPKYIFLKIRFFKYQGAGNDFVMLDDRNIRYDLDQAQIAKICNRHFGVGADGLILLRQDEQADFRMVYYNADGRESTMCGNGGRCIAQFAYDLQVVKSSDMTFFAIDGLHHAKILDHAVALQMVDVGEVQKYPTHYFLNTGSPHHVAFVEALDELDVKTKGKQIRYGAPYFENGSNVNFVEIQDNILVIRTYERGVEDETLACGTGVTAAAIVAYEQQLITDLPIKVKALGGNLEVNFEKVNQTYRKVWLTGPAKFVFEGIIDLNNEN